MLCYIVGCCYNRGRQLHLHQRQDGQESALCREFNTRPRAEITEQPELTMPDASLLSCIFSVPSSFYLLPPSPEKQREGNHITPSASSSSSSSAVTVLHHGGGVSWVRLAIGDKNKCLSSQWGGSYNLAGVMYACAVDSGGEVTRLGNTLEPTKQ